MTPEAWLGDLRKSNMIQEGSLTKKGQGGNDLSRYLRSLKTEVDPIGVLGLGRTDSGLSGPSLREYTNLPEFQKYSPL
jgi:hypothetical protein